MSNHPRNVQGMWNAPRCGARTRKGTNCRCPAVAGRKRCRMHGGAPGSGAPPGNVNALREPSLPSGVIGPVLFRPLGKSLRSAAGGPMAYNRRPSIQLKLSQLYVFSRTADRAVHPRGRRRGLVALGRGEWDVESGLGAQRAIQLISVGTCYSAVSRQRPHRYWLQYW